MPKPPEGSEPKTPRRRGTATAGAARATTPKAAPGEKPKRAAPKPAGTGTTAARKRQAAAAGPEAAPKARPRHHMAPDRLQQLIAAARASLEDDKAEDIVVLDVTGRANFADCMIIATGLADRQIQAMAAHLEEAFEKVGFKLRRDRIQGSPDWVLIDADDLVIHLFKPEARANYALERMWGPDSPKGEGVAEGAPEAG